jgi:hypothetical protein
VKGEVERGRKERGVVRERETGERERVMESGDAYLVWRIVGIWYLFLLLLLLLFYTWFPLHAHTPKFQLRSLTRRHGCGQAGCTLAALNISQH